MAENFSAAAGQAQIDEFKILPESGKKSLAVTPMELCYYESLLDHTIRCFARVADTGYRSSGGESVKSKDLDGRHASLKITDGNDKELKIDKLRISNKKGIVESANKLFFDIHLVSPEYHDNPKLKCAVTKRYDGRPEESVKKILTEYIKTEKQIDADASLIPFNFTGKSQSPFYLCSWLGARTVPDIPGARQNLAGYFFYETADGYKFKSIDKLFIQDPRRILIFNDTTGKIPPGYDGKILDYTFVESFDLKHSQLFASGQSQLRTFDLLSQEYVESEFNYENQYLDYNTGGTDPIKYGEDQDETCRKDFLLMDTGIIPSGSTKQQLDKSKELNYIIDDIVRQSKMRYNSLYNIKLSIKIAGDITLRAGDLIYCDFPNISGDKFKVVDPEKSGIYMIHDVCHRITKNGFYTGMNLVRESIGRKPF